MVNLQVARMRIIVDDNGGAIMPGLIDGMLRYRSTDSEAFLSSWRKKIRILSGKNDFLIPVEDSIVSQDTEIVGRLEIRGSLVKLCNTRT